MILVKSYYFRDVNVNVNYTLYFSSNCTQSISSKDQDGIFYRYYPLTTCTNYCDIKKNRNIKNPRILFKVRYYFIMVKLTIM